MRAGNVAKVVGAVADWQSTRARVALTQTNEITALRLRAEAAETLLEVLTDAMLEGTSADPARHAKVPG